jgi:phosphoserine phosphatase RsbU/P
VKGWEFADKYAAALEVGGDYYAFLELGDGRVGIAIGDVCGKGVPAALYMARLSGEVRYHSLGQVRPHEILERVNQALCRNMSDDLYVTLQVVVLDPATGICEVASAGHLPPMVRRANGKVEAVDVAGCPPAGFDADARFESRRFDLHPGDVAVLYTDGVTEAMAPGQVLFDDARLMDAMARAEAGPEGVLKSIAAALAEFVRDEPPSDDRAIVCFGRVGAASDERATLNMTART